MQEQFLAWGKSLGIAAARLCWQFAPTLVWVGALLALLYQVGSSFSAVILLVLLILAAAASFIWFPTAAPLVGDWRRARARKANRRARVLGYTHGVALKVVQQLDADAEAYAMRRPVRRLPSARLIETPGTVSLLARQSVGSTDEQLMSRAEAYAPVLGVPSDYVRIERVSDSVVRIVWNRSAPIDRLAESIPFRQDAGATDPMEPLLIGCTESGAGFRLNLWDRQTLVLGASGSGKGSLVWGTMLALAPHIRRGTVRVRGVDLKGGVELMAGFQLFDSVATTYEQAAAAIAGLRAEIDHRLEHMVSVGSRKHAPTVDQPAILLLVDEYASLVYSAPDSKAKAAVEADLKRILSTGRAARINILALAQDPRADSILARSIFTNVVALRFRTADDATLALGASSVEAGAKCHLIPQSQPGTGYVIDGESGEILRFRAFWVADEVIADFARRYGSVAPLSADQN